MKKGFFSFTTLLLMGITIVLSALPVPNCTHNAVIFLRDMDSGLLSEALDHNTNISGQVSYQKMPDSLYYSTQEDIVYLRDDKDLIYGYMTDAEFKAWMGCKGDV